MKRRGGAVAVAVSLGESDLGDLSNQREAITVAFIAFREDNDRNHCLDGGQDRNDIWPLINRPTTLLPWEKKNIPVVHMTESPCIPPLYL